jgi:serine phosphatase RsbU (regulator of sigma subunit)
MRSSSPGAADEEVTAALVQQILSGIPAGCTWLLPIRDEQGDIVDFRVAATSDQGHDLYGRGVRRREALLSELYPTMVGGALWQAYVTAVETSTAAHLPDFQYTGKAAGIVAESLFDVTVTPALGGLLVWWQRIDEDRRRVERIELLGRLGWAEYNLATGASDWSPGMYRIFEQDPALGPMPQAEQAAALLPEDRGISETAWQTLDSGGASDVTVRFRLGGIVKHLRILSDVARDADGAPLKIHAVVQDLTARENTRTEIERLRDQLRSREMTALAEHRLAAQLQNMIQPLPRETLRLPGAQAIVKYLPAESAIQVGGDWYHAQPLPDGQVVLAIGDVAGHGLEAASGMAHLRYALVAWLSIGITDPAVLLGNLNRLCVQLKITCTSVIGVFDPATRQLRWARAGHAAPLRARSGTVSSLGVPAGLLLGGDEDTEYPIAVSTLERDDLVLFYTDGLVERRPPHTDRTGQVQRALAAASQSVSEESLARLVGRIAEPSPHDDTCILAMRVMA